MGHSQTGSDVSVVDSRLDSWPGETMMQDVISHDSQSCVAGPRDSGQRETHGAPVYRQELTLIDRADDGAMLTQSEPQELAWELTLIQLLLDGIEQIDVAIAMLGIVSQLPVFELVLRGRVQGA